MMKSLNLILLAFCCSLSTHVWSQNAGELDSTFNTTGKYTFDYGFQDNLTAVRIQPSDQKVVVAGTAITPSFSGKLLVSRLLPDGTPDLSFANNGSLVITNFNESYAYEIIVKDDGKLLIAGAKADPAFQFSTLVMRLNTDGTIDTTFGNSGFATHEISTGDDFAYAAVEQPDHKIVLAGSALDASFNNQPCVMRLLEDGSVDSTFGVNGVALLPVTQIDNKLNSIMLQPDGKVVVCGHIDNGLTVSGQFDFDIIVARLNPDGTPDTGFGVNGLVITSTGIENVDESYGIALAAGGKILVSGFRTQPNFSYDAVLLQYDSTGVPDAGFGTNGLVIFDENVMDVSFDLTLQPDGKILSAGISGGFMPDDNDFWLARYNTDGSPDITFGTNGRVITSIQAGYDEAEAIDLQSDGKAVLAGKTFNGSQNDIAVARFLMEGTTGIADASAPLQWSMSPNPVKAGRVVHLENTSCNDGWTEIVLHNPQGVVLVKEKFECTNSKNIDFRIPEQLGAGCYFLSVRTAGQLTGTGKLVITK